MSAAQSLPNPENIRRVTLSNGLTVLVRENHAAPVVVLEGSLPAGAILDPADKLGLSSITANMLTRGSTSFDYALFNETIEAVGASLSITSDTDALNVGLTCLSEDFSMLVDVMTDALRHPIFPVAQFDLVKRQKLVRLQERDQDTASVANLRFYDAVYGGHPYGRPVSGQVATVNNIRLDDLLTFYATHITPSGGVLAISGDVDATAVIDLLHDRLSDWKGPKSVHALPPILPINGFRRFDLPMVDKVQADIVIGSQAVNRAHPDFDAVRVANTILGVFGMMGRLGEVVREQHGLAYYAYSSQDAGHDAGVWMAAAGVNPTDVTQAVESILAEFARLRDEAVTAEELSDSQAYLTGVLPLTLETNDGIASTLLNMEWYGLGLDYVQRYDALVKAVTVEDVQRVAQTYLQPERCVLVVAGG